MVRADEVEGVVDMFLIEDRFVEDTAPRRALQQEAMEERVFAGGGLAREVDSPKSAPVAKASQK